MKRLFCATALLLGAATPVVAMDILHCSDTDAIGYQWRDGVPTATRYVPYHFIVKIVSRTERIVDGPDREYDSARYTCTEKSDPDGAVACVRVGAAATFPIAFQSDRYERIGNMSAQVGGAPDLYVAFGRCEPF